MNNYDICIKSDVSEKELTDILSQSYALFDMSEETFLEIKNKGYFKRLWDIITFSKDGEIFLAKNICTLAKAQDVLVKLMISIVQKNRDIDINMSNLTNSVIGLTNFNHNLLIKLREIIEREKFGKKLISAADFNDNEKRLFIASINSITEEHSDKEFISDFRTLIYRIFDQCFDKDYCVEQFENISSEKAAFLHQYYLILNYICEDSVEVLNDKIENIIDVLSISTKNIKQNKDNILSQIKVQGISGTVEYYKDSEVELTVSDDDIEFEPLDIGNNGGDINENNVDEAVDLADDTFLLYWDLMEFLAENFPNNCRMKFVENEVQGNSEIIDKIHSFIKKNHLNIEQRTSLCVFDSTVFGGAKDGILLTTWGLYYKEFLDDKVKYVSYRDMENISVILNAGSQRSIQISRDIIIPENKIPNNFVDVLRQVHNITMKESNFTANNDRICYVSELDNEYKKLYIKTIAELLCGLSISVENKATQAYLMCMACDWKINLDELSDVWDGKVDDTSVVLDLERLKKKCPYPMYTTIQMELIKDIYRINYEVNKNILPEKVDDLINTLISAYDVNTEKINTDAFLFDLRIEDDSLTNEQIQNVSSFIENVGTASIVFLQSLFSTHPIMAIGVGVFGNMFKENLIDRRYNKIRVEMLAYLKEYYENAQNKMKNYPLLKSLVSKKIINVNSLINKYNI